MEGTMKVERSQLGFASGARRFTQTDAGRRVGAASELTHRDPDESNRKRFTEDEEEEVSSPARHGAKGEENRLLNITA